MREKWFSVSMMRSSRYQMPVCTIPGDLDFGVMHLVERNEGGTAERVAEEGHDLLPPLLCVFSAIVGGDGILGEALRKPRPVLCIETPQVLVFQSLDGFDFFQQLHGLTPLIGPTWGAPQNGMIGRSQGFPAAFSYLSVRAR